MLNPAQPGHNRSSSPSATLADMPERKVLKHGSQANPTIDPRHDSEPMHIMLYVRGAALVRVFRLITPYSGVLKPLVYWPYQSVRLHNVITEHMYIKNECNNRQELCIVYSKRLR